MTSVDRITFQQTFNTGDYTNVKLGIEMSLVPGLDDVQEAFRQAKEIVNDAFKSLNPTTQPIDTEQPKEPVSRIDILIKDIESCTEVDWINTLGVQEGLIAYANTVIGFPELQAAYDLQMIKLKQLK